jgi:hypothetical protein
MDKNQQLNKREQARNSLPDSLKPVFDEIVEDYKFATIQRFGRGYAAYMVLADLVRVGWRHSAEALPEIKEATENNE